MDSDGTAFGILYGMLKSLLAGKEMRSHARKWVRSDVPTFGSFRWCCEELGLDSELAKEKLLKRSKKEITKMLEIFELEKQKNFDE